MTTRLYLFLILTTLVLSTTAQEPIARIPRNTYRIPFELTEHNNISVQLVLNKQDTVRLMFHTAASSVTLTEEAIQKLKSLRFSGTDTVSSWGGGGNSARFSPGNSLQAGALQWNNIPIWENKHSGRGTDGKFGLDLFQNKVVEIDFDQKQIILHDALPRKSRKYEKLPVTYTNDLMFVQADCQAGDSLLSNKMLIHSGYAGAVLLDDQFAATHKLAEKLTIVGEKELKDSYGNSIKTQKVLLPALLIGQEKLALVPAGFFAGAIGRQKMSILGFDVLKRFNLLIDAQRAHIYLRPNKLKRTGYMNV